MMMVIMLLGYFLLKMKYMVFHEEWSLVQQTVLAKTNELERILPFSD
jgi:hypothetical protein